MIQYKLLKNYLGYLKTTKGLKQNTINNYEISIKKYLQYVAFHGGVVSEMKHKEINEYIYTLGQTYSQNRAIYHITTIRSFYGYLLAIGEREGSIEGIDNIYKREKPKAKVIYDNTLFNSISDDIGGLRNKLLISIGLYTGCRIAEIMSLNIRDILTPRNLVITGKGSKKRRIMISQKICDVAKQYYIERKIYILDKYGYTEKNDSLLISHSNNSYGKSLGYSAIKNDFISISNDIGTHIRPHNLRHSFASNLYDRGLGINNISDLLGHSHISTTSDYISIKKDKLYSDFCLLDR